jgi:hypothetical protein
MQYSVVRWAPQPGVLRDGNHRSTLGLESGPNFGKHVLVIPDMLNDIKGADHIEFVAGKNPPRIHLHQGDAFTKAPVRENKPPRILLTSAQVEVRERSSQSQQH